MPSTETAAEVARLDLRLEAAPTSVAVARRQIADFAHRHGLADPGGVALAVTEGVTNVVLHAYRDGRGGPMRVVACARHTGLVVVVRDYGCGMSPNPASPGPGLGLSVMAALAGELNIERPDDGGTRLRMGFANRAA